MKEYKKPVMSIIDLTGMDVICASGGNAEYDETQGETIGRDKKW